MSHTSLNDFLHSKLDEMGAPPRENAGVSGETHNQPAEAGEDETLLNVEANTESETELAEVPEGDVEDGDAEAEVEATEQAETAGEVPDKFKPAKLAEAIGWTAEELYNDLEVPIGNNGETLSLGEMKDRFEGLAGQQAEVEQAREQLKQQFEQFQQGLVQGHQQVSEEVSTAQQQLSNIEAQYTQVQWDKLEAENAGQAANLRQKFMAAHAAAKETLQQAQVKDNGQRQQAAQQMLVQNDQRLLELVPEWKDMETFKKELPEIQQYMLSKGFQPQELQNIVHAGARAMARDAWLWQKHLSEVKQTKGKLRKAPRRVMRPGTGANRSVIKNQELERLSSRAIETGRGQDRLAAARAIVQSSSKR